jgi:hypothetical protein
MRQLTFDAELDAVITSVEASATSMMMATLSSSQGLIVLSGRVVVSSSHPVG